LEGDGIAKEHLAVTEEIAKEDLAAGGQAANASHGPSQRGPAKTHSCEPRYRELTKKTLLLAAKPWAQAKNRGRKHRAEPR
jgi:hypothetical protein